MKKILMFLAVLLLVGCEKDLNNTPTKRVEVFLNNYQSISEEVASDIMSKVDEMPNLTENEKQEYVNLWKRHYQGLTYEIKDEVIDGDDATVTVEIEVYDYSKIMTDTSAYLAENPDLFQDENGLHSFEMFNDYRIEELKKAEEKVTYTIDFRLKKIDQKWILQDLTDEENLKMSGMYEY